MPKTILIVDIDSGSVGAGLARLSSKESPRLFAETRQPLPVPKMLATQALLFETEKALRAALMQVAEAAARLRTSSLSDPKAQKDIVSMGSISGAIIFFGTPWSSFGETPQKTLQWEFDPTLASSLHGDITARFGHMPIAFHATGAAATRATQTLFGEKRQLLISLIGGEVSEIILMKDGGVGAHATIPTGSHDLLRTLGIHAGMSTHEARSALHLDQHRVPPFSAAAKHFSLQFKDAAESLLRHDRDGADGILLIAEKPTGTWFAKALSLEPSLLDLFPQGGAVQALQIHHVRPHIVAHASVPDLALMLEAMYLSGIGTPITRR